MQHDASFKFSEWILQRGAAQMLLHNPLCGSFEYERPQRAHTVVIDYQQPARRFVTVSRRGLRRGLSLISGTRY